MEDRMQSGGEGRTLEAGYVPVEELFFTVKVLDINPLEIEVSPEQIPVLIAELRAHYKLTQAGLGQLTGDGEAGISGIEDGSIKTDLDRLIALFDAMGGDVKIVFREREPLS